MSSTVELVDDGEPAISPLRSVHCGLEGHEVRSAARGVEA
jgi:hypothetical protein